MASESWPAATRRRGRRPGCRRPARGSAPAPGALPIDLRHAKGRVAGEILAQFGGGRRLEAQIHLEPHRLRPGSRRCRPASAGAAAARAARQGGEPGEQVEVAARRRGDARAQHLDRDLRAVGGRRRNGPARSRRRRRGRRRSWRTASRAAARIRPRRRRAPGRAGKRRQPILQLRQIGGDLVAEQIGAGSPALAELDEARPQLAERRGQPLAGPGRADAGRGGQQPQQRRGHGRRAGQRRPATARRDAASTRPMANSRDRFARTSAKRIPRSQPPGRNGARRCRRTDCGTRRVEAAPSIIARSSPGPGSGGCSRPDTVGVAIAGHRSPRQRQDVEGIEVIGGARRHHHMAEFQAEKPSARLEHAAAPRPAPLDPGHVAQAEGDRVGVERAVGNGQRSASPHSQSMPSTTPRSMPRSRPTAIIARLMSHDHHARPAGAAGSRRRCRRCRRRRRAGSARARPQPVDQRGLPQPMDAPRSSGRSSDRSARRRCRTRAHERGLVPAAHKAKAEIGGVVGMLAGHGPAP